MGELLSGIKSTTMIVVLIALVVFVVFVIVGMIVDKKKTWKILQWVMIGVGIVLIGWIAATFKVNVGKYFNNLIGRRKKLPTSILNESGNQVGEVVKIIPDKSPIRDRGVIKTSNGTINLPDGIQDVDVGSVMIVESKYHVEKKHRGNLTDVFD